MVICDFSQRRSPDELSETLRCRGLRDPQTCCRTCTTVEEATTSNTGQRSVSSIGHRIILESLESLSSACKLPGDFPFRRDAGKKRRVGSSSVDGEGRSSGRNDSAGGEIRPRVSDEASSTVRGGNVMERKERSRPSANPLARFDPEDGCSPCGCCGLLGTVINRSPRNDPASRLRRPFASVFSHVQSSFSVPRKKASPPPPPPCATSKATQSVLVVLVLLFVTQSAGACSSRSTPKPRPPSHSAMRPNITFQTYACPPAYAAWYCLNGATCFTVKIADSILYNCECADGYMGQRCEFKDLEGSYLPARERFLMGRNSKAGNAFLGVLLIVVAAAIGSAVYTKNRTKSKRASVSAMADGLHNVSSHPPSPTDLSPFTAVSAGGTQDVGGGARVRSSGGSSQWQLSRTSCGEWRLGGCSRRGEGETQLADDFSVVGQSISYSLSGRNCSYDGTPGHANVPTQYYMGNCTTIGSRHPYHSQRHSNYAEPQRTANGIWRNCQLPEEAKRTRACAAADFQLDPHAARRLSHQFMATPSKNRRFRQTHLSI